MRPECETVITFDTASDLAEISSYSRTIIKRLLNHEEFTPTRKVLNDTGDLIGLFGTIPKDLIKVAKRRTSNLSEEERREAGERLKNARNKDSLSGQLSE